MNDGLFIYLSYSCNLTKYSDLWSGKPSIQQLDKNYQTKEA